ncbi:hypothetical protein C5S35_03230 [Candidatus Methanophagaceae archaeon]|nr:hypothetical protein C5S35_03230 [Methanophagales archaeon]
MQSKLLEFLACPGCLDNRHLRDMVFVNDEIVIGGSIELIGIKKMEYKCGKINSRDVITIDVRVLNIQQIACYMRELIHDVFKVFSKHTRNIKSRRIKGIQ